MDIFITVVIMIICLLLEAFFSGSEIGIISADKIKLRHNAANGSKGAKLALEMLEKPEWLLSTTLIGTNIAVVTNTTIATALMINLFGESYGLVAAIGVVAPLIWIFGEIVPKSVFQQKADVITPYAIFVLWFASRLFFPILLVFTFCSRMLAKIFGVTDQSPFALREEIVGMLQMPSDAGGDIQMVEKRMISRMLDFSKTKVEEIMVPLINVNAIERNTTCGDAVRISVTEAHIRMPVYEERVDQIVGILHTLDLLGVSPQQPIEPFIRPARYIPGTKGIKDLLVELRQDADGFAIVVDEFGGAEGIVSIEDIMEEVVEELEDEYDSEESSSQWVRKISNREYLVSARIELDSLKKELGIKMPASQYLTLAGFLLERTQEVPVTGTIIKHKDVTFLIQRTTPQAIQEVRIYW